MNGYSMTVTSFLNNGGLEAGSVCEDLRLKYLPAHLPEIEIITKDRNCF